MAKNAEIEDVIAKISRESFGTLITNMGVDMVLNPIDISANYIVRCIKDEAVLSSEIINGQVEFVLVEVDRGMSAQGKDIKSLKLPRGLVIVALQREGKVVLTDDETKIIEGDHLAILSRLTESFDLEKFLKVKQSFFA
jgi:trk system potassium uptake protein TrkA